jgi:hypothetical protein
MDRDMRVRRHFKFNHSTSAFLLHICELQAGPLLLICPLLLSYLFFLVLTIILATVKSDSFSQNGRVAAVVICLIFQMLALAWYVLSYIPFGRDMVKKCFGC